MNVVKQPKLFCFVPVEVPGCKVFCEPGTIHYRKTIESFSKIVTVYLEVDNQNDVTFNGLHFT